MATPEGKIKRWLDTMLKKEGVWYFSPQAGPYGSAGIPDRIVCADGMFLGIECKADSSKKPTALQNRCMAEITSAGGKCFVVYDKETIEQVREYIVSARSSRQESIGTVNSGQGKHLVRDTNSEASPRLTSGSPSPL